MTDAPKRILLIDDEPEVQDLLALFLKIRGYQGFFAHNGEQGIEMAKKLLPDLILLDIMMPKVDGFRVQATLREDPEASKVPIIFITAKAEPENAQKAISSGAKGFIEKPFDLTTLTETIQAVLGRS